MTVRIFVPDIPEFMPIIEGVRDVGNCKIQSPINGYWQIEDAHEVQLRRRELGLGPALWNSALTGGFQGRIVSFDRDVMVITSE